MKLNNLLIILSISFFIYLIAFLFLSSQGFLSKKELQNEISDIKLEILELEKINLDIKSEVLSFKYNIKNRLVLEARKAGYYKKDEYIIELPILKQIKESENENIKKHKEIQKENFLMRNIILIIISILIAIFMVFIFYSNSDNEIKKNNTKRVNIEDRIINFNDII